jgi:thiamine biosynthesis lipoprotein
MPKSLLLPIILVFVTIQINAQEPIKIEGNAQGTTYHITYFDKKNRNLKVEITSLLSEFDLSVSTYNPNSIISKINNNQSTKVDKYFKACFTKAKEVWKNTNGAFDPTVYPLVSAWGFGQKKKLKIEKTKIDSILQFVGFDMITLKGKKVLKKDPRIKLDFNAFAQGYSVDVVADFLIAKGIKSFVVEIGGEVYAHDKKPNGDAWKISIEEPYDNQESENPTKAIAELNHLAIATSGNNRQYFVENGVKYAHHIDPKTGYPAKNNLLSASIFAKDCISSDANATGVLVMGLEKAKAFLKEHSELEAYLLYSDEYGNFKVYKTAGMDALLVKE